MVKTVDRLTGKAVDTSRAAEAHLAGDLCFPVPQFQPVPALVSANISKTERHLKVTSSSCLAVTTDHKITPLTGAERADIVAPMILQVTVFQSQTMF